MAVDIILDKSTMGGFPDVRFSCGFSRRDLCFIYLAILPLFLGVRGWKKRFKKRMF
jgi:hypothetical protein